MLIPQPGRHTVAYVIFYLILYCLVPSSGSEPPAVGIRDLQDAGEAERIIASTEAFPIERRISFISKYFLGRRYHPETKTRIRKQRGKRATKREAANQTPKPVEFLPTSLAFLDCMTYVEHVLALASADRADYAGGFLPRLVDVMYDAEGRPLMNHLRSHFTSRWADVNERKGYLANLARGHPAAASRDVVLNRVGGNRTFYVEDRFLIASAPQAVWYFPLATVLNRQAPLKSGDIVALVCQKEGLDVTHMGFFIEHGGKRLLRHASYTRNRIIDEDFDAALRLKKDLPGLMVFRPILTAPPAPPYRFTLPSIK